MGRLRFEGRSAYEPRLVPQPRGQSRCHHRDRNGGRSRRGPRGGRRGARADLDSPEARDAWIRRLRAANAPADPGGHPRTEGWGPGISGIDFLTGTGLGGRCASELAEAEQAKRKHHLRSPVPIGARPCAPDTGLEQGLPSFEQVARLAGNALTRRRSVVRNHQRPQVSQQVGAVSRADVPLDPSADSAQVPREHGTRHPGRPTNR